MRVTTPSRVGNDAVTTLGIGLLVAGVAVVGVLRAAGSITAWATRADPPTGGLLGGARVLAAPADPGAALGAPGLNPIVYWLVVAVLAVAAGAAAVGAWRVFRRAPATGDGFATRTEVARSVSARAVVRAAAHLRPTLSHPRPADVGYRLGSFKGQEVWASVEDSLLLIGPPRSGKGHNVVINMILDAPGAVITTATRPDTIAVTLAARQRRGPVAVFDPQQMAPGLPVGMRWSPVRGCQDPQTAAVRARGLAAASGFGTGTENGGYWESLTRSVLEQLLHAAALGGRTAADLHTWSSHPASAADAVAILTSHPGAAPRWGENLNASINADPRTRDAVWNGVKVALAALSQPRVLDAVSPRPGEEFDPHAFIRDGGTLYLLATSAGSGGVAPLVAAFVEDLTETAKRIAARSPGGRLDPPLLLALDEIGNLAPLPSLPMLMSDGGGSGITVMPVLQSLAQARTGWGEHQTGTVWDAAITKIILGGSSAPRDLQDLAALLGERDETTHSTSVGADGGRSTQTSLRRVPVMSPQQIRNQPRGHALILTRSLKPIRARLRPWTARPDRKQLRADKQDVEAQISGL
ncbi:type IV secretory system conjugative DNA transfer family protein [Xylanimonas protaetiae]|uniref:Type VI secretion protein n=1 Tax=Xylanimonas protaetiae TaxID=2509457 RepID=A0A4P6F056_9MICO|nr:TraM recognition domain-containing protein [Xylanimonas protaetiae]QAY68794.1 type VI secretion protein [Xylanimonas protaetiae]